MSRHSLALLALLAASACVPLPPAAVSSSLQATPELQTVNPSNIAVVPVEDATPGASVHALLEVVRDEIYAQLVLKRYAPLTSKVVDAVVREKGAGAAGASLARPEVLAQVAGTMNEDAVLCVRVTQWNDSRVMSASRVRFAADVIMVSARTKATLWGGAIEGEVKAGGQAAAPRYREERLADIARQMARAIISQLPSHVL